MAIVPKFYYPTTLVLNFLLMLITCIAFKLTILFVIVANLWENKLAAANIRLI